MSSTDYWTARSRSVPSLCPKVHLIPLPLIPSLTLISLRWDYLLRTKNHTVEMPFLFPAPDFTPRQLQEQGIVGTCEVQICRSIGSWSNGVSHTEHSIQNAYIKAIQLSEYFVYVENQFFITSTVVEGVVIGES
jgi:phosphatidylserine/phosphatidylglycerophosphate/cardiolipin synthase-like enzyme